MWMYYSLGAYILLSGLCIFSLKNSNKTRLIYIILTMGLLAFLAMFRSQTVGNDTDTYISLFYKISASNSIMEYAHRFELGYLFLNRVLSYISSNHQVLLITTSVYIYLIFGRFIYKYSSIAWLSVFLFFTLKYFDLSMSGIRQMLAIATIILSYEFVLHKKPFKFLITILVACLFHNSAIIFLAAYPLSKFRLSKKLILVITVSTAAVYVFFEIILNRLLILFPRYNYYLGGTYIDGQARIGIVAGLLVMLAILVISEICNHKVYYEYSNNGTKYISVVSRKDIADEIQSVYILIACAIMAISLNGTIFNRFANIYSVFSLVYLPNSLKKLDNKWIRLLITLITIILFFGYATTILIYKPEWQSSYPYSFFWNE